jgi:hypothetical protein
MGVHDTIGCQLNMRCILAVILLIGLGGCAKSSNKDSAVDNFNQRTIHKTLDPKTLEGIADSDLEQAIVDYIATKLEGNYEREEEIVATLPKGVRALWLTWVVEGEVNNGGFNQYYWNTGDRFASDAVEAFRLFGATQHASLMEEANTIRAQEVQRIQKFKDKGTLNAFSESYKETKLGPLDTRFYALKENLSALRIAKIRSAPELFSGK